MANFGQMDSNLLKSINLTKPQARRESDSLKNQTDLTSDESTTIDMSDAAAIRKQLDGLESMYSEVLKLLGLRKHGRMGGPGGAMGGAMMGSSGFEGRRGRKGMYGSMSSLPSVSSIGSRHIYKVRKTTSIETVKMVAG